MITTGISGVKIKLSDIISLAIIVLALVIYAGSDSMGTIELGAALLIFVVGFKDCEMKKAFPALILTGIVLALLVTSGKMGETGFNAPIKHALKFVHLLFAFVCYLFIKNAARESGKKLFVWVALCASAFCCLRSIYYVVTGSTYAIRYSSRYGYDSAAGFSQIYGIPAMILIVCFLFFCFARKDIIVSLILLIFLAVYLYFIYVSLMATALILTAAGICLLLYVKLIRKSKAAAIGVLLVLLLAAVLIIVAFPEQTMALIKRATGGMNYVTRNRILYVSERILQTPSGISYTYDRRNEIANYSAQTFLAHPLFGVRYSGYGYGVIGSHQEWIDLLAVFGFPGAVIVWGMMGWMIAVVYKDLESRKEKELFLVIVIMFVILGFLNPCMGAPLLLTMFAVAPNARVLLPERAREKLL